MGGDLGVSSDWLIFGKFQSTPPRGRRPVIGEDEARGEEFQSTPPRGRRRRPPGQRRPACRCFNPRLRVGGDISRSAPVTVQTGFNPRLRVGGDARDQRGIGGRGCFNPRLRVGGDRRTASGMASRRLFQSTPPRGRRPSGPASGATDVNLFQSTPPRGRRQLLHALLFKLIRFQSTPPRGRRRFFSFRRQQRRWFQSTPPRGRRRAVYNAESRYAGVSIHASAWEATGHRRLWLALPERFNPRLRVGGDQKNHRQGP